MHDPIPPISPLRPDDVSQPLRARLLEMSVVGLGVSVIVLESALYHPFRPLSAAGLVVVVLAPLVYAGMMLVLFGRATLRIRALRVIELLFVGVTTAFLAFRHHDWMASEWYDHLAAPERYRQVARVLGSDLAVPWILLIVLYGTQIPNPWQRCATVVGLIALVPVVLTVSFVLVHARDQMVLTPSLRTQGSLLLIAVAIAISSSWKYTTLRREASDARRLGPYHLLEKLGEGGMGVVYRAEHRLLRRPCALKLIRPDRVADARSLERFRREVQVLAGLTHWNIVRVFDYGQTPDGVFYYVMEHLSGLDLFQLVAKHGPQSPARAVYILRQLCAALHEAHGDGLVHRDVKPSNIVLTTQGGVHDVVKLMDFGLVQATDMGGQLTEDGFLVGTPLYMSPEQAGGENIDARSDLYSVGLIAYFLMTGRNPFERPSARAILRAHLLEQPAPLIDACPRVDTDLNSVVMNCLEADPARRFPTARALEEALNRCSVAGRWTETDAISWWARERATSNQV